MDQLTSGSVTGERNGKQIFTAITYEHENTYTEFELIPFGKFDLSINQFSEYTDLWFPWDSKPILKPFNHKGSFADSVFVGDTMATQSAFFTTFPTSCSGYVWKCIYEYW